LLGQGRGNNGKQRVITASQPAMKVFYEKMQDRDFTLTITAPQGQEISQSNVNNNPTRGNIEKIAASAPQAPAAAISQPLGGGGVNSGSAPAAAPAGESGMRAALAGVRGPGVSTPSAPSQSFDRGFKPTGTEMAKRDEGVIVEMAKAATTTNELLNKQIEGDIRREKLLEKIADGLEGASKPANSNQPAAAKKVAADVEVSPLKTGRKY
jgi:hypothetical protein